jgi:hypothetical protein
MPTSNISMTFISELFTFSIVTERTIGSIIAVVIIALLLVLELATISRAQRSVIITFCIGLFIVFMALVALVQRSIVQ